MYLVRVEILKEAEAYFYTLSSLGWGPFLDVYCWKAQVVAKLLEVTPIGCNDSGTVFSCGQGNENVVLKVLDFSGLPTVLEIQLPEDPSSRPPVRLIRCPARFR